MKMFGIMSLIALGLLAFGPGPSRAGSKGGDGPPPEDFALVYHWQTGTVSPLYFYSYEVTIKPDGRGQVAMIPSYTDTDGPVWTESFEVSRAERDNLYLALVEKGLFTGPWRSTERPPMGAGRQWLKVNANGAVVEIPADLAPDRKAAAEEMFSLVKRMAPQSLWDGLQTRLEKYRKERSK
jgi:hypothetical protein